MDSAGLSGLESMFFYQRLEFGRHEGLHEIFQPIRLSEKASLLSRTNFSDQ
jgi:hypothetical protein